MTTLLAGTTATAATKAELRSSGGDRITAIRLATAVLAQPLDLQVTNVRCERIGKHAYCGVTLSGVTFYRAVRRPQFERDLDALVRVAFAVDASVAEIDLHVSVPANLGKGAITSGDFAVPASATVFAMTATRAATRPSQGPNVFWDPVFRHELDAGSRG